jgi:hypothetical protein
LKKFIKGWLLPPKMLQKKIQFSNIMKLRKYDLSVIQKNSKLKEIHLGERCFILGNGPSINEIDILTLKGQNVFVMSSFYHHDQYLDFSPMYHALVDISDSHSEGNKFECLKEMSQRVVSQTLFFGIRNKTLIEKHDLFRGKTIYYVATLPKKRTFNIAEITATHSTGPLMALEVALYMGFSEIYLLGIDLNGVCTNSYNYFFDRKKLIVKDPEIAGDGKLNYRLSEALAGTQTHIKGFEEFEDYSKSANVKIYNLTQNSLLRMFEYKNIKDVIFDLQK